jgi:hypothetical protein
MAIKADGKYTLESARARLKRNGARIEGSKITHGKAGIGDLGAIDFLVKHGEYHRVHEIK